MIDNFSKVACVFPLRTKAAEEIELNFAKGLEQGLGIPKMIISDNGSELKNSTIEKWKSENKVAWKFTSPYNPQANGVCERFNGIFLTKLTKLSCFGAIDWVECLDKAWLACMYSVSRATGIAPIEFLANEDWHLHNAKNPKRFIWRNLETSERLLKVLATKKAYHQQYASNEEQHNRFKVDDKVIYAYPIKQSGKLAMQYEGAYIIVKAFYHSYLIKNISTGRTIFANEKYLKKITYPI